MGLRFSKQNLETLKSSLKLFRRQKNQLSKSVYVPDLAKKLEILNRMCCYIEEGNENNVVCKNCRRIVEDFVQRTALSEQARSCPPDSAITPCATNELEQIKELQKQIASDALKLQGYAKKAEEDAQGLEKLVAQGVMLIELREKDVETIERLQKAVEALNEMYSVHNA